jgi:hypothetical protein
MTTSIYNDAAALLWSWGIGSRSVRNAVRNYCIFPVSRKASGQIHDPYLIHPYRSPHNPLSGVVR